MRLHRRRQFTALGQPAPLDYQDIAHASERCVCELSAHAIQLILEQMDDVFLEWLAHGGGNDHSSGGN